ncbi:MAG TPA: hybrid sensor histidine kinase/response regulator [Bryobacteraceae bacterium]|jgi:DNA-binding response OmpR family regulator|nr:hybrid sensor histidine kinase/response regulator [Bryobacteraceae bacterium]
MAQTNSKSHIMAVDDQPANLKLLEDLLGQQGHVVRSFPRGRLALEAAARNPPDLILLDINMPEMSGFKVCELLKANEKLARIPVIFLSALADASDKVHAFQSGGVDYVTKPFQVDEVQARVRTHLKIHQLQKELLLHANHLEQLVDARTKELAETQARLKVLDRAKSDFLRLIHHELRSPLNGLLGVGELVLDEMAESESGAELREMFELSRQRMLTILDDALLLTEIEVASDTFSSEATDLVSTLEAAIESAAAFAQSRGVAVELAPGESGCVLAKRDLLVKAMQALIETAVKFSKTGQVVRLECLAGPDGAQVLIRSCGRIPESAIANFFQVFSIGDAITPGGDLGLGPPVSQRILSLFGGSISVENLQPSGIQLTVALRNA